MSHQEGHKECEWLLDGFNSLLWFTQLGFTLNSLNKPVEMNWSTSTSHIISTLPSPALGSGLLELWQRSLQTAVFSCSSNDTASETSFWVGSLPWQGKANTVKAGLGIWKFDILLFPPLLVLDVFTPILSTCTVETDVILNNVQYTLKSQLNNVIWSEMVQT